MTMRWNRASKHSFLGCSNYPTCRKTMEVPQDIKNRLADMPMLPLEYDNDGMLEKREQLLTEAEDD
jgi:ssDNA-binding Zn-finger/Zn-ribbon topoisomerase 1